MTSPRMAVKLSGVALISLALAGCAIAIPVQEATPPETLGAGGVRVQAAAGLSPMIGFDEGANTVTQTAATTTNEGIGLDIGILENLDIEAYYGIAAVSSDGKVGLKLQWMGQSYFKEPAGTWAGSVAARYVSSSAGNFTTGSSTSPSSSLQNVAGQGFEVSNSFGYRWASWSGFYVGPKAANINITGQLDQNGTGNYVATSRNVTGYGGFLGLYLNPHTEKVGLEILAEVEEMNFPSSFGGQRVWYPTFFLSVGVPFHF